MFANQNNSEGSLYGAECSDENVCLFFFCATNKIQIKYIISVKGAGLECTSVHLCERLVKRMVKIYFHYFYLFKVYCGIKYCAGGVT